MFWNRTFWNQTFRNLKFWNLTFCGCTVYSVSSLIESWHFVWVIRPAPGFAFLYVICNRKKDAQYLQSLNLKIGFPVMFYFILPIGTNKCFYNLQFYPYFTHHVVRWACMVQKASPIWKLYFEWLQSQHYESPDYSHPALLAAIPPLCMVA